MITGGTWHSAAAKIDLRGDPCRPKNHANDCQEIGLIHSSRLAWR